MQPPPELAPMFDAMKRLAAAETELRRQIRIMKRWNVAMILFAILNGALAVWNLANLIARHLHH